MNASFITVTKTEWLKTKRTASVWLTVLGAGFMPALMLLIYLMKPATNIKHLGTAPWNIHIGEAWQVENFFLFPMFVILICSLITQVEYKNNAWKQVYASPVSIVQIYLSKLANILMMVLLFFVLMNVFLIGAALVVNLVNPKYLFLSSPFPWKLWLILNIKSFVGVLGIVAIQYWISVRFRNFILPMGVGLAMLIIALIGQEKWDGEYLFPYAYPILTLKSFMAPADYFFQRHEWLSLLWFVVITAAGLIDTQRRKEY